MKEDKCLQEINLINFIGYRFSSTILPNKSKH